MAADTKILSDQDGRLRSRVIALEGQCMSQVVKANVERPDFDGLDMSSGGMLDVRREGWRKWRSSVKATRRLSWCCERGREVSWCERRRCRGRGWMDITGCGGPKVKKSQIRLFRSWLFQPIMFNMPQQWLVNERQTPVVVYHEKEKIVYYLPAQLAEWPECMGHSFFMR